MNTLLMNNGPKLGESWAKVGGKAVEEKPVFHSDSASIDIVLSEIVGISEVSLLTREPDERHFFVIRTQHLDHGISVDSHQVIYPTKFEAEAVKAALHGKIIDTREKDVWWVGYQRIDVDALNALEAKYRDEEDGEHE